VNNDITLDGVRVNYDLLHEQCDDGNLVSGDGCASNCQVEITPGDPLYTQLVQDITTNPTDMVQLVASAPLCGNGVLEAPEECDDSNKRDGDGCNSSCILEIGICGDGKVEKLLGEQCESATFDHSLLYDCVNCRFVSRSCGDGKLDPGEECDRGPMNSTSPNAACRPDCSLSRCGDGIKDTGELCDDGNRRTRDGCDAQCHTEVASDRWAVSSNQSSVMNPLNPQSLIAGLPFQYGQQQNPFAQNIGFPQYPNDQPLPMQLPLAQLQPIMQRQTKTPQTGPAAVAVIGAGAAAGFSWMRNRRRRR